MILPLESQCCSLESAKKLKEIGFSQESLFYWVETISGSFITYKEDFEGLNKYKDCYSAYTASELGDLLPGFIIKDNRRYFQSFRKNVHHEREGMSVKYSHGFSYTAYWDRCYEDMMYAVCENTEVEARAKMLTHLSTLEKKG